MVTEEQTKDGKTETEDIVRKIWLAGLGAYAKSRDEAQSHYDKFSDQTSKMFDELVKQGENLEGDVEHRIQHTSSDVETRVNELRKKFGLSGDKTEQKIAELSAKIDTLADAVAKLAMKQKNS